jgi:hypothetical protein
MAGGSDLAMRKARLLGTGDEWREGTASIPEMLFLAAEFYLVLLCSRDLVEEQRQLP